MSITQERSLLFVASMKQRIPPLALGLAIAALWASPAGAQDITVSVLDFSGRAPGNFDLMDLASISANPISQGECDAAATVTFRFSGVDTSRSNLHLYQGALCDDVMVRNDTTDDRCSELAGPYASQNRSQPPDLTFEVSELVPCGAGGAGIITVWVLALNSAMADEVSGAGQKVTFPIAYDFQGPSAPADFTATGGETTASLTWTGSGDQITSYEIYLDPSGCGGTFTDPPDPSLLVATIDGTNSSYALTFPDTVATPGEAAVVIRAIDRAGNASAPSSAVCVNRFTVTTWWETYCGSGGTAAGCAGSGCSVEPGRMGARSGRAPLAFGLALGLALVIALGRRRNR